MGVVRGGLAATLATAAGVLVIDQAAKLAARDALSAAPAARIEVWPPYLVFVDAWNEGVNFGLFASGSDAARWFFVILASGISAAVLVWARRRRDLWFAVAAGLVVGGALGNVIDRLRLGAVYDFLNMSCCGIDNPFVFNLADVAIFAGAAGLMLRGGADEANG